jgi:hypothetical protein
MNQAMCPASKSPAPMHTTLTATRTSRTTRLPRRSRSIPLNGMSSPGLTFGRSSSTTR